MPVCTQNTYAENIATVTYRLIAAATITFSKRKCVAATKQVKLLYEAAIKPLWGIKQQRLLYGTYVSDVTGNLHHIAITCSQTLMALP